MSSAIGYLTKSIKNFAQTIRILNHNGITKSKLFVNDDAESHNEIPVWYDLLIYLFNLDF